jgi:hypothetical protein
MKFKNQKPIDIDAHLKYRCPNPKCEAVHWISALEAKVNKFKIVCYCGLVFRPKRIKSINIKYYEADSAKKEINKNKNESQIICLEYREPDKPEIKEKEISIPIEVQHKSCLFLTKLGFTKKEASELIKTHYKDCQTLDYKILVKHIITMIGE